MRRNRRLIVALLTCTPALGQVEFFDETFEYDRDHPASGRWLGTIQRESTPATFAEILIQQTHDTRSKVAVTALALSARNAPCEDVVMEGRSVRFVLVAPNDPLVFVGTVSDDGQRLKGSLTPRDAEDAGEERGSFNLRRVPRPIDLDNPMRFSGTARSGLGIKLEIAIVLAETPAGNWVGQIDLPRLGLVAYPIVNLTADGNSIRAEVPLGRQPAQIEAILDAQQAHLVGKFRQRGIELSFDLARSDIVEQAQAPPVVQLPQWVRSSWLVRRHTEEPWALVGGNVIDVVTGKIQTLVYTKEDFDNGSTFTITIEGTGEGVWTESAVDADAVRAPRQPTHDNVGAASLYAEAGLAVEDYIAVANDRIKIVIASGGNLKSGTIDVVLT